MDGGTSSPCLAQAGFDALSPGLSPLNDPARSPAGIEEQSHLLNGAWIVHPPTHPSKCWDVCHHGRLDTVSENMSPRFINVQTPEVPQTSCIHILGVWAWDCSPQATPLFFLCLLLTLRLCYMARVLEPTSAGALLPAEHQGP